MLDDEMFKDKITDEISQIVNKLKFILKFIYNEKNNDDYKYIF
jgi:hypothetical protein